MTVTATPEVAAPAVKPLSKMTKVELQDHIRTLESQGAAPTPAVATVATPAVTASDLLKSHVEGQGLAFARGGRTIWNVGNLQAAVNVLQTGEPTIVSLDGVGTVGKRGVKGMAIGLAGDGKSVITQYVYKPES